MEDEVETSVLNRILLAQQAWNLVVRLQEKIDEAPFPDVIRYMRAFGKAQERYARRRYVCKELMKRRNTRFLSR